MANIYVTCLLMSSLRSLYQSGDRGTCRALFHELTTSGGLFFRGLIPRTESHTALTGVRVYKMDWRDPTTWLALAAGVVLVLVVIPFSSMPRPVLFRYMLLGLSLLWINWKFAATWIILLSRLAIVEGESAYVDRLFGWTRCTACRLL
jgi:hypothetical protein